MEDDSGPRKEATKKEAARAERPAGLIGAVDNVLRLLRMFEDSEMLRVNQVARDMGLSRSTVHRMLATLGHHGFVEQDALSRAYRAGPALIDIGLSVVQNIDIRTLAHGTLVRLRDEIGETVHLAHLRGTEVVFLDSVESTQTLRTSSRIGWTLPAHATAAGKVLLADLPADTVAALYPSDPLSTPTPNTLDSLDRLRAQLHEVRERGYATNDGESEDDVRAVAVVVRDKRGRSRAAISVTAPSSRAGREWMADTAEAARHAAAELSGRIG